MNLFALDHFLVWLRELESPAFQVVGENNVVCVMPFNGRTALRFSALGAVRPVAQDNHSSVSLFCDTTYLRRKYITASELSLIHI